MNTASPPSPRPASTVILLREGRPLPEVFLLKRSPRSGFMGGYHVFPGGGVEEDDTAADLWEPHLDLPADQVQARLGGEGLSCREALGFAVAAVRETFEEAGVLLARTSNPGPGALEALSAYRFRSDSPENGFRTAVARGGWRLSLSTLGRWARWITPERMNKRFDTRFFLAPMPPDQTCSPDGRETETGLWITPGEALARNLRGLLPLSPPTVVTLTQLLDYGDMEAIRRETGSRPWGDALTPRLVSTEAGPVIVEPWDPLFETDPGIHPDALPGRVLAPGARFSRLWCDGGIWKPVRA
jgi:8-oxo-dGTP pyrophosphatase MutT (NUDIX family)